MESLKFAPNTHSSFSQTYKVGNVGIIANFVSPIYVQFSSLFTTTDDSKCEIRNQWVYDHYILRSNATLDWLIFSDKAKTKLAMLAFLYCGDIVKNSIESEMGRQIWNPIIPSPQMETGVVSVNCEYFQPKVESFFTW